MNSLSPFNKNIDDVFSKLFVVKIKKDINILPAINTKKEVVLLESKEGGGIFLEEENSKVGSNESNYIHFFIY